MAQNSTQIRNIASKASKWRLIVDLLSPYRETVNDGIEYHLCCLDYLHLDEVTAHITKRGWGTMLAKMGIASAYRIVPGHLKDWPLLAIQWMGQFYLNTRLPFGRQSAPKFVTQHIVAVTNALQWVLVKQGVSWVAHYLDNYITMGSQHLQPQPGCHAGHMFETRGPNSPRVCAGPVSSLVFLGFKLNTETLVVRLPAPMLGQTQYI